MTHIHLGYEVGSGQPIGIPLRNLAVTGQTQESGKTTTLEALVQRSGLRAIAFVTKRGEGSFSQGNRIQPYFRERADWQFVDQLLEAQLREKNKFLRSWIIRLCRTTRTLAEVHAAVKKELVTAKGFNQGIYTQLDAYLELIVPEIESADLADTIALKPGLNVMDVSAYPTPMQMLFVQSAIDWVNEHEEGVVTIVPEAWEFIPEGKGSPVKNSAVTLVRKGSGIRNHIWVDSQDMAGVDKVILRGCPVWLIGVQRESNEIKRNLANIPAGIERPKPSEIARLERGQFYACFGKKTIKVYVQPAWMDDTDAEAIARGNADMAAIALKMALRDSMGQQAAEKVAAARGDTNPTPAPIGEPTVTEKEARELREENARLLARLAEYETSAPARAELAAPAAAPIGDESFYQTIKNRLLRELPDHPRLVRVLAEKPEIMVQLKRNVIEVDGTSAKGRIARLIASGWFDGEGKTQGGTRSELRRTGADVNSGNISTIFSGLVKDGFLTAEAGNLFRSVEGMKVNIVEGQ